MEKNNFIEMTLEQFICKDCNQKFYINKDNNLLIIKLCPVCNSKNIQNIREFLIDIKKIEDKI